MGYIPINLPPDQGGGFSGFPFIEFPRADLSFENVDGKAKFNKLSLHLAEALDVHIGRQHTFGDELREMSRKDTLLTIAAMAVLEVGVVRGARLVGATIYTVAKLYVKDPNMRFFSNRYLSKLAVPATKRIGWRFAGRTMERLSRSNKIRGNPIYKTLSDGGATIFKGKAWNNRLEHLKGFDPKWEVDYDVQKQLKRFLREEAKEDEMPYNRRTGQWYPARRRGYSNRGRYDSRRGYGGYPSRRRRSYRRW